MSMQETYETTADNLFAATQVMPVVADKLTIAQAGELKRGTLLTAAGAVVKTKNTDEVYAVLAENVDTTSAAKDAAVYLTGEYNKNALIVDDEADIDDFKASARKVGIFIKNAVK